MTRIFFLGNKRKKTRKKCQKLRGNLERGYALFVALGFLLMISAFFVSSAAIFSLKTKNLESERRAFLRDIKSENEKTLSLWKNQGQGFQNEVD